MKIEGGNYELNKAKFETEADKIYQELGLNKKKLEIEEERLVKDYIVGILQINTRAEQMAQAWRRVKIEGGNDELNKAKYEVEADKIYQELGLTKKRLDIEEERLVKDYIVGILQSGVQLYKR